MHDMLWRIELDPPAELTDLADRMVRAGWQERSRISALRDLEGPDGHRLVMVPRTGRIQIRIHYLTPPDRRSRAAWSVHQAVEGFAQGSG